MTEPDSLLRRMDDQCSRWESSDDARCIFLGCYALMTRHTLAALDAGRFADREWINRLVRQFADYYFSALEAYELEAATWPDVWKLTFELARSPMTSVMEDLLLGINAHINHDLPLAISDTLLPDWRALPAAMREDRAADHRRINRIIAETMQPVQQFVVERHARLAGAAAKLVGTFFNWEFGRIITAWRADVWTYGVRLTETDAVHEREALRGQLDKIALARVQLMLSARQKRNKAFGYPISRLHARGLI